MNRPSSALQPSQCLTARDLLQEHQHAAGHCVSRLDLINAAAQANPRKALDLHHLQLTECRYGDDRIACYRFGNIVISRQWRWQLYYEDDSPGWWIDTATGRSENGVMSLLEHMSSPEYLQACMAGGDTRAIQEASGRFQPDAQPGAVIFDLAARLGIDLNNPTLPLPSHGQRWRSVETQSRSSPPLYPNPADAYGIWPKVNVARIPFLGYPHRTFEIKDKHGRVQLIIGAYDTTWNRSLLVPFSLWHRGDDPLVQRWKLRRSDRRHAPFGVQQVIQNLQSRVLVVDDLALATDLQTHVDGTELTIVAWPRSLPGEHPRDTDWSPLAGRNVSVLLAPIDRDGCQSGHEVCAELRAAGVESLSVRLLDERIDLGLWAKLGGNMAHMGQETSPEGFTELAASRFGLQIETRPSRSPQTWHLGDASDMPLAPDYVIEPIMPVGSISVLYSEAGKGKSWLALLLAYSVACGIRIVDRWHAPRRRAVLYISSEMTSGIADRIRKIDESLGGSPRPEDISVYPHPDHGVGKIDLLPSETWEEISHLVAKADLLIIDHLTNVTDGSNSPETWKKFWRHLDGLRRTGKTILILHHAGKDGRQRGTSKLVDDVDFVIRMDALPDIANGAMISFDKYRDDLGFGRTFRPFKLLWDQDEETGRSQWWAEDPDESAPVKEWKMPPPENAPRIAVNESLIRSQFQGRTQALMLSLAEDAADGGEGLGSAVLASRAKVSKATIRTELGALFKQGLIVGQGNGKAKRYRLGPEASERFLNFPR